MLHISICDDEIVAVEKMRKIVGKVLEQEQLLANVGTFENGEEFLNQYIIRDDELVILDLDMPKKNGIDVIKELEKIQRNEVVILVTAYDNLAIQSFSYGPFQIVRKERLEEHITEMKKPFALVQLIPATFRSDCVPMYDLYREGKLNFDDLFNGMIYDRAVPNVDGIYFPDYSEQRDFEQLQIFNNGAVELKMDFQIREQNLRSQQLKTERYLIIFDFEAELRKLIQGTSQMYQKLGRSTAMYVCVTIVGCKDLWNYTVNAYGANTPTKVDRNQIVCTPIEIQNIQDDEQVREGMENCIRMTKYSLGIRL